MDMMRSAGRLLALVALGLLASLQPALAACSTHVGKVVINEVYRPTGAGGFVELKVIDPSVATATSNFQNWKLDVYAGNHATKASVDVSSGFQNIATNACGQTSVYIRFPDSVINDYLQNRSLPFNFVLYDSSGGGKIVDIMRLGDNVTSFYSPGYTSCQTVENQLPATGTADSYFDAMKGSGNSVKDWYRNPDGTGPWGGQGTSNPGNSVCSNNGSAGAGSFGLAKVPSTTAPSVNTDFSYTLYARNGATGAALTGVTVTDNLNTAGLTYVSCTTSAGTCGNSGGVVTWNIGNVALNTSLTATLTVRAATAGVKTNVLASNVGTPVVTATSVVQVVTPLADWRMDDSPWNGTASEVVDSSGNGYHGRARIAAGATPTATTATGSPGPAYTSASQNTCGYGQFDKTTATVRTYTYVELTSFPTLPSSFTFTAWIRSTNASAQHQRILVRDDADNGWGLSLADGTGSNKLRFFNRNISNSGAVTGEGSNPGCGVFCLDTNAVVSSNVWHFVAAAIDTVGKSVTLYVYDSTGNLLAQASSTFSGTWQDGTGLAAIGGETSSSSEGRQTSWHFLGNIDEVQIFSGVLTQSMIQGQLQRIRTCPVAGPHHLEIQDSTGGSGLTCTPSTLTVKACADANSPCTAYTGGVSGTLTAAGGATVNWGAGSGAFTITSGSSTTTKTVQVTTPASAVTFGTSGETPATSLTTSCTFPSPANNCSYTAADAGLLFDVPHHAAETSQTFTVSAVKKSDNSLTCTPAFASASKSVNFKCSYSNPAAGAVIGQLPVRVGGVALNAGNSTAAACDATGNSVSLAFDASGVASTTLQYADVGQLAMTATYTGSGADAGLTMTGSDSFIAAPKDFALSAVTAGPIGAGNAFSATVTARNNAGTATNSFSKESVAESATLSLGSRVAPAGANDCINGPCNGTVAGSVTLPWSGGAATASNLSYSEVGQITLTASLASGSYLGSGLTATGTSGTVGAFVPAYFDTAVTQGCVAGSFTYSAQPFRVDVTARNAAAGATLNYSSLAGCLVCSKDVTLSDPAATSNFNGTNSILATAFARGVGSRSTVKYTLPSPPAGPTAITLRATDASVTPNVSSSGHTEGAAAIRFGILKLDNAYGSELLPLRVPVRAMYWTGTTWATNTLDSCTTIPAGTIAIGNVKPPASPLAPTATLPVTLSNGASTLVLTQGATKYVASADIALNLTATTTDVSCNTTHPTPTAGANLPWLQGKWGGSTACPSTLYDRDPNARITFGSPKAPYIYLRERY